jgi:hypothetical protein
VQFHDVRAMLEAQDSPEMTGLDVVVVGAWRPLEGKRAVRSIS